jgi:hypothetical protein
MKTFRLEFNEKKKYFHHCYEHQYSYSYSNPNTHGFKTIMNDCSDEFFKVLSARLDYVAGKGSLKVHQIMVEVIKIYQERL